MNLADFLSTYVRFSHEELNDILSYFKKEKIAKNQLLIKEGQVCKKLYFVEKGMARSYYLKNDGKEVTQWFFDTGKFMTSADSYFNQSPSYYYLETLEDSIFYTITYEEMDIVSAKYPKMQQVSHKLVIEALVGMVDKLNAIQFQTSKERYDYMTSEFPDMAHRVPLGHIASYLGMTQETLSRIRRSNS